MPIDFGTKNITVQWDSCNPNYANSFTMRLSGQAEVNGDHICTMDTTPTRCCVAWKYIDTDGVTEIPISGSQSFYFTSANETYILKATLSSTYGALSPSIREALSKIPYGVSAVYAPIWANGYGYISVTPDTDGGMQCRPVKFITEYICKDSAVCSLVVDSWRSANEKPVLFFYNKPAGDTCSVGPTLYSEGRYTAIQPPPVEPCLDVPVCPTCSTPNVANTALVAQPATTRIWRVSRVTGETPTPITLSTDTLYMPTTLPQSGCASTEIDGVCFEATTDLLTDSGVSEVGNYATCPIVPAGYSTAGPYNNAQFYYVASISTPTPVYTQEIPPSGTDSPNGGSNTLTPTTGGFTVTLTTSGGGIFSGSTPVGGGTNGALDAFISTTPAGATGIVKKYKNDICDPGDDIFDVAYTGLFAFRDFASTYVTSGSCNIIWRVTIHNTIGKAIYATWSLVSTDFTDVTVTTYPIGGAPTSIPWQAFTTVCSGTGHQFRYTSGGSPRYNVINAYSISISTVFPWTPTATMYVSVESSSVTQVY